PLVVRQAESESDFLFEHHWRKRPIRSFLVTAWRSVRPVKFWRSVSIYDRVVPRPLLFLLICPVLISLAAVHALAQIAGIIGNHVWGGQFLSLWYRPSTPLAGLVWTLAGLGSNPGPGPSYATRVTLEIASSLLAMLGSVLVLRQTLARCRVRPTQVLRVVAYSAIPATLLLLFANVALAVIEEFATRGGIWPRR